MIQKSKLGLNFFSPAFSTPCLSSGPVNRSDAWHITVALPAQKGCAQTISANVLKKGKLNAKYKVNTVTTVQMPSTHNRKSLKSYQFLKCVHAILLTYNVTRIMQGMLITLVAISTNSLTDTNKNRQQLGNIISANITRTNLLVYQTNFKWLLNALTSLIA